MFEHLQQVDKNGQAIQNKDSLLKKLEEFAEMVQGFCEERILREELRFTVKDFPGEFVVVGTGYEDRWVINYLEPVDHNMRTEYSCCSYYGCLDSVGIHNTTLMQKLLFG